MSSSNTKHHWTVPHVLVLIIGLVLICCGLTYVLPAGEYAIDAATGLVVPNSFHYLDRSPVDPWRALIMVTEGVGSQGVIFALLFIMGGLINVVIESGAIHSLINYSVYRLEDKSITVLVPSVVVLMAVIVPAAAAAVLMVMFHLFAPFFVCSRIPEDHIPVKKKQGGTHIVRRPVFSLSMLCVSPGR